MDIPFSLARSRVAVRACNSSGGGPPRPCASETDSSLARSRRPPTLSVPRPMRRSSGWRVADEIGALACVTRRGRARLAKVDVEGSSPFSRSKLRIRGAQHGEVQVARGSLERAWFGPSESGTFVTFSPQVGPRESVVPGYTARIGAAPKLVRIVARR